MKPLHSLRLSNLRLYPQQKQKIIVASHLHPGNKNQHEIRKQNCQTSKVNQSKHFCNLFTTSCVTSIRHSSSSKPESAQKSSDAPNESNQSVQTQNPTRKNPLTIESALEIRRLTLLCLPTGSGLSGLQTICKSPTVPAHKKFVPIVIYYQQALQHVLPAFGYDADSKNTIHQYGMDYMEILSAIPESNFFVQQEDNTDLEEYEKKLRQTDFLQRKLLTEDRDIFMFFAKNCLGFPKPTYQYIPVGKARRLTIGLEQYFQQQSTQSIFVKANQKLQELSRHGREKQIQVEMINQMRANPELFKMPREQMKARMEHLSASIPLPSQISIEKKQEIIMNSVKEAEIKFIESFGDGLTLKGDNGWYNYKFSLLSYASDPTIAQAMKSFSQSIGPHLPMETPLTGEKKQISSDIPLVSDALVE